MILTGINLIWWIIDLKRFCRPKSEWFQISKLFTTSTKVYFIKKRAHANAVILSLDITYISLSQGGATS